MIDEPIIHDHKREATASIRGYVYQAYQSVLAWMRLKESEILFLEGAEDFDIHEGNAVETTQVKDTAKSGPITLRSSDVVKAINNFWKHRQLNPDKEIRLRFLTTSIPGQETNVLFGSAGKGLEYWELAARDDRTSIGPLKECLLGLELDSSLKHFLNESDEHKIREELICPIHWDTGSKPKDALMADILDQLVMIGSKRGVDSRHSEQALDSLLRRIADLLSSNGTRRITYADFLRAFDEATMELMPRGEAAALRQVVSRIAEPALAFAPAGAQKTIITAGAFGSPLPIVREATKRELLVNSLSDILRRRGALIIRGSNGIGKTSVARLVTDNIGGNWAWAGFRGCDGAQVGFQLRQAASELAALPSPLRIVLDDLDLAMVSLFEREFLLFAFSVVDSRGLLLLTGPNACPSLILQKLWLQDDCNQEIPYFNEEDIKQLIVNHGAPRGEQLEQLSDFIAVTTAGHPQLAHARVRSLQKQNWPPVETLNPLRSADLQEAQAFARRRLTEEMPSENARVLAYRLSLITGQFSRRLAITLAELSPAITLPGEVFDTLVGPWIEKVTEDMYRVSPLLQNAGDKTLSSMQRQGVHETVALSIARMHTLSPLDFSTALLHAMIAKSPLALSLLAAGAIAGTSRDMWRALADAVFWFPSEALQSGQRLYQNDPNVDTLLRVLQFRIAAAGQRLTDTVAIVDRTIETVDALPTGEQATSNAAISYTAFLMTFDVPIPSKTALHMISRLMDLVETDQELKQTWANFEAAQRQHHDPLAGLTAGQVFFSMRVSQINGIDDLAVLLDALETLDVTKRTHLLATFGDETLQLADVLIGGAWWRDVSNDRLDADRAIATLRRAVELGREWKADHLVRAAFIGISVLYDEYKRDSESALNVLEEAAKEIDADDPKVLNQHAKVLYTLKRYQPALNVFTGVLLNSRLPTVERIFSSRLAGICAAHTGDWKSAEDLFVGGATTAKANKLEQVMAVGLMADAAFARWKQDKRSEALSLYAEVLNELELIPLDQDPRNRRLHATIRHCLGWIDTSGRIAGQEPLAEPPPGVCSNPDPQEGFKDLQIVSMAAIWGLLGAIDVRLQTGLGLMKLAEEKHANDIPILMRLHERLARYEALWKEHDISNAVSVIVEFIETNTYRKQIQGAFDDLLMQAGGVVPLAHDYWAAEENRASVLFKLLALAILATAKDPTSELPLARWREDLRIFGISGTDVENFFKALNGDATLEIKVFLDQAAASLYQVREASLSPQDLFSCHFRLLNFLTFGDWGEFVRDGYSNMVASQWLDVAENQKFALRSPSVYSPLLKAKCQETGLTGYAMAASILDIAATAIGARIAESGKQFLSRVKAGEFPIQGI